MRCSAFPAFRPGDLIPAIGEALTDKLLRLLRSLGRCSLVLVCVSLPVVGPGEMTMSLVYEGSNAMSRSIGSPGVTGNIIGEDGAGVCGLEDEPWFILGARRPDEKKFEYTDMMVVGKRDCLVEMQTEWDTVGLGSSWSDGVIAVTVRLCCRLAVSHFSSPTNNAYTTRRELKRVAAKKI